MLHKLAFIIAILLGTFISAFCQELVDNPSHNLQQSVESVVPSNNNNRIFSLPTNVIVTSTDKGLQVQLDTNSFVDTSIAVEKEKTLGLYLNVYVSKEGKKSLIHSSLTDEKGLNKNWLQKAFKKEFRIGFEVEYVITLFETDVSVHPRWLPTESKSYKELWKTKLLVNGLNSDTK